MTPPLDEKEENEESRLLEVRSRKELEKEGCPPCYPPELDIPLRNIPKKYQAITSYWESFPGTGDVVLRAQLLDWQKFRAFQGRVRRYYRQRPFNAFVDKVCERQRRHKVGGDVHLQFDVEQQSRLENWMEFQDYHLQLHHGLEKKRDELKKKLDDARKEAEGTGTSRFDRAAEAYQQNLEYSERKLPRHKTLLQWIEQERIAMESGYPTPVEEDNDVRDATPKVAYARCRQKRRRETPTVLGNVRVSKTKPQNRNRQCQKRTTPIPEPVIEDSAAAPQSSIPQVPKRRENKPGRNKEETPLRQRHPQRVSKAERFADTNAKSLSGGRSRRAGHKRSPSQALSKHRQSPQQPRSVSMDVITRSGRVSRRPVRWAPEC